MKELLTKIFQIRPFIWALILYDFEKKSYQEKKNRKNRLAHNSQIQYLRCVPWFKDKGDETLRLNYALDENSLVFDIGGYKGEFASSIINKYNCNIHIFEPIPEFYQIIVDKFLKNKKITPHCCGLSTETKKEYISLLDNSSSIFTNDENRIEVQFLSAIEFMNTNNIEKVDLIKINIEGGEYELLEALIDNDKIKLFNNIQVQFHDFVIPNARERMNKIQDALSKTHFLTYQYEFVWENWQLKNLTSD